MIPIGKRVSAVVAERPTRKTYFSHSVRSISEEACASIPVDAKLSTRVFTRSELDPSYSPRMILCNEPVWPITPGRTIAVATYPTPPRSEEHTSELQSLMPTSYAVLCLKKQTNTQHPHQLLI